MMEPVATKDDLNKLAKALQDLWKITKPQPCPSSYDAIWREYAAEIRRAALSDAEARIKELEAKLSEADALIEAQQHDFAQNNIRNAENAHRAEAAEALLKEAGKATSRLLSRDPEETNDIFVYAFRRGVRAAARAIHHKIGVKNE